MHNYAGGDFIESLRQFEHAKEYRYNSMIYKDRCIPIKSLISNKSNVLLCAHWSKDSLSYINYGINTTSTYQFRSSRITSSQCCHLHSQAGDKSMCLELLYMTWRNSPQQRSIISVDSPRGWWIHQKDYLKLSQMALDILAIPAMSSEVERVFSN